MAHTCSNDSHAVRQKDRAARVGPSVNPVCPGGDKQNAPHTGGSFDGTTHGVRVIGHAIASCTE
jgi:hypothetical protein